MKFLKEMKINLPELADLDDREDGLEAAEKEKEELIRDTEKCLDDAAEIVADINEPDEPEDIKFTDGDGKTLKLLEGTLTLDETGPKDLLNRRVQYKNDALRRGVDIENSTYEEITPEEALKLVKAKQADQLKLLINGHFVNLKPDGWGTTTFRNDYVGYDQMYTNKNGKSTRDTAHMPPQHLFKIADKIYRATEVEKDPEKQRARGEYAGALSRASTRDYRSDLVGRSRNSIGNISKSHLTSRKTDTWYEERAEWYEKRAKERFDSINTARKAQGESELTPEQMKEFDYGYRDYLDSAANYRANAQKQKWELQDAKAATRNALSMVNLQKPLKSKQDLLSSVKDLKSDVARAEASVNDVKTNGSAVTKEKKRQLEKIDQQLKELRRKQAVLMFDLEDTSEDDQEELAKYQAEFEAAQKKYEDAVKQIMSFKKTKKESLEELLEGINEAEVETPVEEANPSILSSVIKAEYDLIDLCNGVVLALEDDSKVEDIRNIISREYENIATLEAMLQEVSPEAAALEVKES